MLTHGLPSTSIRLHILRICRSPFKSSYLKNKKHFLCFLFHPKNLHQILNTLEKNKNVIANVFLKLTTVRGLVTPHTIQRHLKTSFDGQHVTRFQTLAKSSWEHFYQILSSLWVDMICKISPWLKFETIALFAKTWTADDKYPLTDFENLLFPNQRELS